MSKAESVEVCVDRILSFDEIAKVAIYLNADVAYRPKAQPVLRKALEKCKERIPKEHAPTCETLEEVIGWGGIYNDRVRGIVDEFGYPRFVDRWGAFCWTDANGNHCGDQWGFYSFWDDEKALRRRLEEGRTPK